MSGLADPPLPTELPARLPLDVISERLGQAVWRGDALGRMAKVMPSGYSALDAELPGGGWPLGVLTELLFSQAGCGEFRLLAPTLAKITQQGAPFVVIGPPHRLVAPALEQLQLAVNQVLVIEAKKPADQIWACHEVVRSADVGAVMAWLPQARPDQLRRLQLATSGMDGLVFLIRPPTARAEPSPAPLRLFCTPAPAAGLLVDLFKRRGPTAVSKVLLQTRIPSTVQAAFNKHSQIHPPVPESYVVDRRSSAVSPIGSGLPALAETVTR